MLAGDSGQLVDVCRSDTGNTGGKKYHAFCEVVRLHLRLVGWLVMTLVFIVHAKFQFARS